MSELIDDYCENELVLFGELTSKGLEEYYSMISIQDPEGNWVTLKGANKNEQKE